MVTTTNVNGLYDFRIQANQFTDTTRTTAITAVDNTQLVKGSTDTSPVGTRHLISDTGIGYGTTGNSRALIFSGSQATGLTSFGGGSVFNSSSPTRVEINIDLIFVMPAQTLSAAQTIFGLGHSSGTSLFTISLTAANGFSISHRTSTGSATNTATFGPWAFDTVHTLSVRLRADTGLIEVLLDGTALTVTQSAPFETGTMSLNRECLGARLTSAFSAYYTGRVFYLRTGLARLDADRIADHNELNAAKPSYAAVPAITVTGAQDVRMVSYTDPVITLAGSVANVTGTPNKLFARVVRERDGTEARALVDSGATFTGSTFTGGTVGAIPADYGLRFEYQVRDAGGTTLATIQGGITFNVGDIILAAGSSTGERMGSMGTGTARPYIALLNADTESSWRINDTLGSGYHAFGDAAYAITGRPIGFLNCARGSTALDEWVTNSGGIMSQIGTFWAKFKPRALNGLQPGAGANDTFKAYVASNSQTVRSRQAHQTKLGTFISQLLTQAGGASASAVRVVMAAINNRISDSANEASADGNTRPTMARGAEVAFARSLPRAWYVSSMDLETISGDIHLTDAGQIALGARLGKAYAQAVVGQTLHPYIKTATFDATGVDLAVQHTTGTDFGTMPGGGWVGFKVYDDLGNVQTLTATRKDASTLRVAFTVDPARAYSVGHLNGTRTTPQTSICTDNSTPPLSLEPTIDTVGKVLLGDGTPVTVTG